MLTGVFLLWDWARNGKTTASKGHSPLFLSASAPRPPLSSLSSSFYLLLLHCEQDNIPPASCLDKLMLRCQPGFWCIPPALAFSWPRTPAPTAETFQCFSGVVFTLQQIGLLSSSVSAQWTVVDCPESSQYLCVVLKNNEKRADKGLRDPARGAWMSVESKFLQIKWNSNWTSLFLCFRLSHGKRGLRAAPVI